MIALWYHYLALDGQSNITTDLQYKHTHIFQRYSKLEMFVMVWHLLSARLNRAITVCKWFYSAGAVDLISYDHKFGGNIIKYRKKLKTI